jgi:hypothetical protein
MEALLLAAACYWALTAVFTFFQKKLETRVNKGYVRGGGGTAAPTVTSKGVAIGGTGFGQHVTLAAGTTLLPGHGGGSGGGAEMIEMPASDPGSEDP